MTNLIYIDEEHLVSHKFSSKIKYLFFELGFYFDGSVQFRELGNTIGARLFGTSTYADLMTFKRYYALFLRIFMLLVTIGVACLISLSTSGILATVVSIVLTTGGIVLFITFLSQKELEIIDKSHERFVSRGKDNLPAPSASIGFVAFTRDSRSTNNNRDIAEEQFNAELNKLTLSGEGFLGFPVGLIVKLLMPLMTSPFEMDRRQWLNLIHNMIYGTGVEAFQIPKGNKENFKTFFYCVYEYLANASFRFVDDKNWDKGMFCDRLFKCFLNFRKLKVEDLRVHEDRIMFSEKVTNELKKVESRDFTNIQSYRAR